jgi:adenosylcobinamide-GDP ribazoletransferase
VSRAGSVAVDALRLCVGTLTAVPVGPPHEVDRPRAAAAMLLAPLAGLGVGAAAGAGAGVTDAAGFPPAVAGVAAVAVGAAATRFLHVDGLADTADGWGAAAHGRRGRALEVMRRGDVGPVGAATLLLVLGAQVAAIAAVSGTHGSLAVAAAVAWSWAVSRAVLPLLCTRVFHAARSGGLGAAVLGTVPVVAAQGAAVLTILPGLALAPWSVLAAAVALAIGVLGGLAVQRRLGGLTGDVLGAAVEVTLALVLVSLSVPAIWPPG